MTLLERLRAGEVLVSDGAMGTLLMERGLEPGECPEAMALRAPRVLAEIAGLYVEAGAHLVHTNTFGASPLKLAAHGLEDQADRINRTAVSAARGAAVGRALVSASVGPSGRILEPYGDVDEATLLKSFRAQLASLAAEGVDAVTVETMTDLREATLAIRAAREALPDVPILATMTLDPTPRGHFTIMGTNVEQAAWGLSEAGADVVGSNCGNGMDAMVEVARAFREVTDLPLLIQANAGKPVLEGGKVTYPETPDFFAQRVPALLEAGAAVVGGCCGTGPEHVRAMREAVEAARS